MIAEKFQAMVYLGTSNSRMKDFYDIWLLARQFPFDGPVLARAVIATFANRRTVIDVNPIAFTPGFTEQPATMAQWKAFRTRVAIEEAPQHLSEIVGALAAFLLPVARACASATDFNRLWYPPGPWVSPS